MGKPSVATQKRLFAVSGNRCAFRQCPQPLVDEASGKVTARICHIKGNKPTSKRHDPAQSEEDRQGFDNLVLMCPVHHDVIDADHVTYTEGVLRAIKAEHEARYRDQPPPSTRAEELFVANVVMEVSDGSIILSANQSGGQTAHIIHNNYGTAPHQPQSAFRAELAKRHLADVEDPEFARTPYHKRMGFVQGQSFQPMPASAIAFAHCPRPVFTTSDEPAFMAWFNSNNLCYEPCTAYGFIPGLVPDRIGSALVYGDGRMMHDGPGHACYTRYLALERAGWVEYGWNARNLMEHTHVVYYALAVANLVGFLRMLRQVAGHQGIDPATLSLGVGLRGIKGAVLECITKKLMRGYAGVTPPEGDNLLFLRSSEEGPWEVDAVAREFADAVIHHWEYARPGWMADTPEFEAGVYKGEFFRESFQHW
jgi:hypothetical protein